MKRLLLVLLVLLGLQTQAQINMCDSVTISGSHSQILIEINNINTVMWYWETTGSNGLFTLAEDSMTNQHSVYNVNPITQISYDTLLTCANDNGITCCWIFIWNSMLMQWLRLGWWTTAITELETNSVSDDRTYDMLGRELFYIPTGTMYIQNRKLHIRK